MAITRSQIARQMYDEGGITKQNLANLGLAAFNKLNTLQNEFYKPRIGTIGLIDNDQLELILEQLLMFPRDTISKNDINWIILISLVDFNNEILPGSRILLYSSDTIN